MTTDLRWPHGLSYYEPGKGGPMTKPLMMLRGILPSPEASPIGDRAGPVGPGSDRGAGVVGAELLMRGGG